MNDSYLDFEKTLSRLAGNQNDCPYNQTASAFENIVKDASLDFNEKAQKIVDLIKRGLPKP